jgi:hypothetical protein
MGSAALDRLGAAFVGTIHGYSFRLLQQRVPYYAKRSRSWMSGGLAAFLCTEEPALKLKELVGWRMFASIKAFLASLADGALVAAGRAAGRRAWHAVCARSRCRFSISKYVDDGFLLPATSRTRTLGQGGSAAARELVRARLR